MVDPASFEAQRVKGANKEKEEEIVGPWDYFRDELIELAALLIEEGMFVETTVAQSRDFLQGAITVLQTVKGATFPPNTFFYILNDNNGPEQLTEELLDSASQEGLGLIVLRYHDQTGFSQEKIVNLWIRKGSPNISLAVLIALQIKKNWEGQLRLVLVVDHQIDVDEAHDYLERLKALVRLPHDVENHVLVGGFRQSLHSAPPADLNIFGMQEHPDVQMIKEIGADIKTSVIFLRDSKHESALA